MSDISRVRVAWSGMTGGPGVSTFFCTDPVTLLPQLHTWLSTVAPFIPSACVLSFESSGDTLDPLNGNLTGGWTATPPANIPGTSPSVYSAPTGLSIKWETGTIMDGHHLRGRTYIVPTIGTCFNGNGQVDLTLAASIGVDVASFVTASAGNLVLWHRPKLAPITHAVIRAGGFSAVTSGYCGPKAAILRSRRD